MRLLTFFRDLSSRGSLKRQISLPAAWRRGALVDDAQRSSLAVILSCFREWWSSLLFIEQGGRQMALYISV